MTRDANDDDDTYETIEILQSMIINRTLQIYIFLHLCSSSSSSSNILVEIVDIVRDEDINFAID